MTRTNNLTTQTTHSASLAKRILLGAGLALILIAFFLLQAGEPNPAWPKFWMIRPLIIVTLAGAMGALFYHLMDPLRNMGGWRKISVNILCLIVYVIALWLGTVLGLDGTLWD
ncbi:potassium transporter KefB [Pedobacter metabolipauper]|uniref:Potassium transporter KefB n=1 Tax=Pedobacter metabolipauper TaxID=425513 RepID=A0A4R6SV05_9SPHI|nr:potassium transporter KefB [Pedobacter metabolipauper]TDQ08181.1 hypothetical protein ATK78_2685 [Pedobacter metabolipauper]